MRRKRRFAAERIETVLPDLLALAQGGTAVGTGLNTRGGFAESFAAEIARRRACPSVRRPISSRRWPAHDVIVFVHGAMRRAGDRACIKIASDIRLMGCGPRAGLGELILPENEPGSSIMPGKVNPTQVEAITMVCARVFGNQATIAFVGDAGPVSN